MSALRAVVLAFALSALLAASGWADPPPITDQVAAALALPDESPVILDGVFVNNVIGQYAAVRDMWAHSQSILISTDAAIQSNWTIRVTGQMATIEGQRVVIASRVQLYAMADGASAAPPFPPHVLATSVGITLVDVPDISQQSVVTPSTNTLEETTEVFDGSIASAKRVGGDVTLTDKVVTAVFHDENGAVTCFYIQEPDSGGVHGIYGVKVVPEYNLPVEAGNLVTIEGSVVADSPTTTPHIAECYIHAPSVKCTGNMAIPKPLGLNQRTAASGHLGSQQALYSGPASDLTAGIGIVGSRVRVWGKVTAVSDNSCWIDDGTGLASDVSGEHTGIRVIYESATPPAVDVMVAGVTGILGAEMDDDDNPVPVIRVPALILTQDQVICVDASTTNTTPGRGWANAFANLQDAVDYASAGDEIWVAAGTYYGPITIDDSIALYGGFAGGEPTRDQRDWVSNETIVDAYNPEVGYSYTAVSADPGSAGAARVDGFTLRNGSGWYGGGVGCSSGHLVLANNVFLSNFGLCGGAVGCTDCTPLIWSNLFGAPRGADLVRNEEYMNDANAGSAIYLSGSTAGSLVANNAICNSLRVAAVYCTNCSTTIADNLITNNWSSGIDVYCAEALITRNVVVANGGFGVDAAAVYLAPGPVVASNLIVDNADQGVIVESDGVTVVNNTILRNSTGIKTTGYGGTNTTIANNIVAFNREYGFFKEDQQVPTIDNNCCFNPRATNYGTTYLPLDHPTDINVDPGFIRLTVDDFHLVPGSPCIDAGADSSVEDGWLALDGTARIQGAHVDIGAYESSPSAPPYVVWFLPASSREVAGSGTVSLSAVVSASGSTTHLTGRPVTFEIVSGPGVLTVTSVDTSSSGSHTADTVLSASAYGRAEVKASTPDGLGGTSESRLVFWFYDPARSPVDIFFCLDSTGSMRYGGDHSAVPSIQALLDYLVSYGVRVRAGGIKFNEGYDDGNDFIPDSINEHEKQPLDWFADLDGLSYWWLMDKYSRHGGDPSELQLDALGYAAQEMTDHGTSSRQFIVLVTDAPYHYAGDYSQTTSETRQGIIDELVASECSVFISLWDPTFQLYDPTNLNPKPYNGLAINGGVDTPNYYGDDTPGNWKYPLSGLRAEILQ